MVIPVIKIFLCIFYVYSCHLFLISSAFLRSLPFLSFIVSVFAWNISLTSSIFLRRPLVFPILLFFFTFLYCSFKQDFFFPPLPLLFSGTLHSVGYIFPFFPCFSLLFPAVCKTSLDNHFSFLHFFFSEMVLVTFYSMLGTSVHNSSGTVSTRSNSLNQRD